MASPSSSARSDATTVLPICDSPAQDVAATNSRQHTRDAQLESCRTTLHTLEQHYWTMKHRFDALPHEVQYLDSSPHLHKDATKCRQHLETRNSSSKISQRLAFLTDRCAHLDLGSHYTKSYKGNTRERYLRDFGNALNQVKPMMDELEEALGKLEAFHLEKTLELGAGKMMDRIRRLKLYYEHVEDSWFAIDLDVRETAKLELHTMRLVVGAFEAPSSTIPPFQRGMDVLEKEAPALLDVTVGSITIAYVEGWSDRLGEQAARLEAYLNRLRAAVLVYQVEETAVLGERERAKAAKAAEAAKTAKKGLNPKALVWMAQRKNRKGKKGSSAGQ